MSYNLSSIGNQSGVLGLIQTVNSELMLGWLGVLMLVAIGGICFMSFMFATNDAGKSLASTSFLLVGFSILLRLMSLIPNLALFITVVLCAGTLAFISKVQAG